jgi:hypothetical protein
MQRSGFVVVGLFFTVIGAMGVVGVLLSFLVLRNVAGSTPISVFLGAIVLLVVAGVAAVFLRLGLLMSWRSVRGKR